MKTIRERDLANMQGVIRKVWDALSPEEAYTLPSIYQHMRNLGVNISHGHLSRCLSTLVDSKAAVRVTLGDNGKHEAGYKRVYLQEEVAAQREEEAPAVEAALGKALREEATEPKAPSPGGGVLPSFSTPNHVVPEKKVQPLTDSVLDKPLATLEELRTLMARLEDELLEAGAFLERLKGQHADMRQLLEIAERLKTGAAA